MCGILACYPLIDAKEYSKLPYWDGNL